MEVFKINLKKNRALPTTCPSHLPQSAYLMFQGTSLFSRSNAVPRTFWRRALCQQKSTVFLCWEISVVWNKAHLECVYMGFRWGQGISIHLQELLQKRVHVEHFIGLHMSRTTQPCYILCCLAILFNTWKHLNSEVLNTLKKQRPAWATLVGAACSPAYTAFCCCCCCCCARQSFHEPMFVKQDIHSIFCYNCVNPGTAAWRRSV